MGVLSKGMTRAGRSRFFTPTPALRDKSATTVNHDFLFTPIPIRIINLHILIVEAIATADIADAFGYIAKDDTVSGDSDAYSGTIALLTADIIQTNQAALPTALGDLVAGARYVLRQNLLIPKNTVVRYQQAQTTGNGTYFSCVEWETVDSPDQNLLPPR